MQAGRPLDAQVCCKQALTIDPNHTDSLHLMGLLCLQAKQYDHAIEWIARANRQDPQGPYLTSLCIALTQQGLYRGGLNAEAFKRFEEAIRITPGEVEIWLHHGNALANLQRPADAVTSYQHVLRL